MKNAILIVTSEFPPLPGGIGNHAVNLARQFGDHGYCVTVITDQRSASLQEDEEFDSKLPFRVIRIKRESFVLLTYLKRIVKTFSFAKKNEYIIASGKFPLWVIACLSMFFNAKEFSCVLHGSELGAGGKAGKVFTAWCLKRYNKLIAVSNFTKNLALNRQPASTIQVINNGFVPKTENGSEQKKEAGVSIITVGSVTLRKGQQNVIKALPRLKSVFPDIAYHVIGLPTEQKKFSELAKQLNVEHSVKFYGVLPDETVCQKLSASHVFCMLSDHLPNGDFEGFGIAVLEANHLGLPAIGSKDSGIADAIKDGFSGKLVNPHDPGDIARALTEIMNNYSTYSQQAKVWAGQFHWSKIIRHYISVISK